MTTPIKKTSSKKPDAKVSEGVKARWWRENIMRMSRKDISDLTGYSTVHIGNIEGDWNSSTKGPPPPRAYQQYRVACAAISAGVVFDWFTTSVGDRGVVVEVTEEETVFRVKNP